MTGLLDSVLGATEKEADPGRMDRFLGTVSSWDSLSVWLTLSVGDPLPDREEILERLTIDIGTIDRLLNEQLNAVLHHPVLQKLEAAWRGLNYLVGEIGPGDNVKVRVLDISWREVARDIERAIEFDQSQLFRKVYSAEFGSPGGEPFGVLLGDYYVAHRPRPDQKVDDVRVLRGVAQVAAAAFAPFVAGAHPALFGDDDFGDLGRLVDLERVFRQKEYIAWNALRASDDARFVGVALPRVLMRRPYEYSPSRVDGFPFREDHSAQDRSGYLWGNPCFAFGAVLVRAYAESAWLAGIRGVERGAPGGGLVTGLPGESFATDRRGVAPKPCTEFIITDSQEKLYGDLGFLPLCHAPGTSMAVFYGTQTLQSAKNYDEVAARANARLSAMMQYVLCVSRFAHYIKVICRDLTGSYATAGEVETLLNDWLRNYATSSEEDSSERQAQFPLREGSVSVREVAGRPGVYTSVIHLRPHFQLDQMTASVKLVTEVVKNA